MRRPKLKLKITALRPSLIVTQAFIKDDFTGGFTAIAFEWLNRRLGKPVSVSEFSISASIGRDCLDFKHLGID